MIVWCGVAAIAGIACSPLIARVLRFRSAISVSLALTASLLCAIVNVDRGVLQGLMRVREYNMNIVTEAAVRFACAIFALVMISRSAASSLGGYVIGFAIAELIVLPTLRSQPARADVDWREFRALLGPLFGLMIAVAIFQNADMLAVKKWMPATMSGYYGAASALGRSLGVLFVPLYVFSGPVLAAVHEQGRNVTTEAIRFCGWFLAASVAPVAIFGMWAGPLVVLLYGKAFAGAAPLIVPIAGIAILTYVALLAVQVFITLGDFRFLRVYAIGAIAHLLLIARFHDSFRTVFTVVYATQIAILLIVVMMMFRKRAPVIA